MRRELGRKELAEQAKGISGRLQDPAKFGWVGWGCVWRDRFSDN